MIMYYGFDIGGTKIALGVFDETLKLQWETRVPTPRESYDEFLTAIAALVAQADARFGVKGSVGIGIPGMPETDDGTLYAANVPAASGKPLRADLSRLLDRDVRLDNDANCFALSEAWDDEFRRYPLVMGLILGTGVGGGIIIDGKPITGRSYITGEFGHIRLPVDALEVVGRDFPLTRCGCGQHGCIENYLSGRGFAWLYEHFYHQKLQAPEIIALWDQGDEQAKAHVERYLDLLAALTAIPAIMAFAIMVRPVIHISRKAEVKQICARSINRPKPTPNSIASPNFGWFNAVHSAQASMPKNTSIPRRNRRRAFSGFCVSGDAALTFWILTGIRNSGSRVKRAPK
jgi:N-acetylglucosamine kinase